MEFKPLTINNHPEYGDWCLVKTPKFCESGYIVAQWYDKEKCFIHESYGNLPEGTIIEGWLFIEQGTI